MIDPNIPLSVRPLQIQSPLEAIQPVLQLQALREQSEARRLAADEARQKAKDAAAIRQILTESGGDIEQALPQLRMIAPTAALAFEKEIAQGRKATSDALTADFEFRGKKWDFGLQVAQSVTDDASLQRARPILLALDKELGALLPETYNPVRWQQVLNMALPAKELFDQKREGLKLFSEGKTAEGLAKFLSTARSQDDWDKTTATAIQLGAPRELVALFGSYSPENVARAGQFIDAKKPEGPAVGSFEDYVVRRFGATPTPEQITQARKDYQQADDRPRITVNAGGGQRPITQTAEAGLISRLNTQWTAATKGPRELRQQVATMRLGLAAAQRGDLAQGTEAVLQPFLKILDPNSVVREGEFFRLREGQSYLARAQTIAQRLTQGGFVPLGELQKYAALAEEIATRQNSYEAGVRERIGKVADRYGIPQELVFETEAPPTADRTTTTTPPPGAGPRIGERRTIKGQLAEWDGKGWKAVR